MGQGQRGGQWWRSIEARPSAGGCLVEGVEVDPDFWGAVGFGLLSIPEVPVL